jgi:hypothetical protein
MKKIIDRIIGSALIGLSGFFVFLFIERYRMARDFDFALLIACVLGVLLALRFFKMAKGKGGESNR